MTEDIQALSVYEQYAQNYTDAFKSFRQTYSLRTPPPRPPRLDEPVIGRTRVDRFMNRLQRVGFTVIALLVMMTASVIVSGSRTIPEFGKGFEGIVGLIVGLAAFTMLEIGIATYSNIRARERYKRIAARRAAGLADTETVRFLFWTHERHETSESDWMTRGMWLSFTVAVVANLDASLSANGVISNTASSLAQQTDYIKFAIKGMLAISAPTLALIAGETLALIEANRHAERDAQLARHAESVRAHETMMLEWRVGLDDAWKLNQGNYGIKARVLTPAVSVSSEPVPALRLSDLNDRTDRQTPLVQTDNQTNRTYTQTDTGAANKRDEMVSWLLANPDALVMSIRSALSAYQQATGIALSVDTVGKALKLAREQAAVNA